MRPAQAIRAARVLAGTGLLRPVRPSQYLRMVQRYRQWGPTPAAGSAIAAMRAPDIDAVVDDRGAVTWSRLDAASNAIARSFAGRAISAGSSIGIMCRNHRGFPLALLAASKLGADAVLLNTEFGGPQLAEVLQREGVSVVVADDEFAAVFDGAGVADRIPAEELERFAEHHSTSELSPPRRPGHIVIMTSGTTGTPKGARREKTTAPLEVVTGAFSRLPVRVHEAVVVAPPLFHGLGFGFFGFSLLLQATLVVRKRFEPEAVLADIQRHRATTLVAVPVMLQRILDLPPATLESYDTSSLRMIVCSGSALDAELAAAASSRFGNLLFNFYGSTETGWATVAGPDDLRAAPGTVGKAAEGTDITLIDDKGEPVPTGEQGRIFVRNEMLFDGYTGGGGKEEIAGHLSTGDVGHFDDDGHLFIDGRADDMIVSGGENVFPGEVEELLKEHPQVIDAAVVGVEDREMGQRLAAFVVMAEGASVTAEELKAHVRSRLARYKVPRDMHFVDAIPRNAIGKVLRRELTPDS